MPSVAGLKRVVTTPIDRVCITGSAARNALSAGAALSRAERFTPTVGCLETDAVSWPQRRLYLQSVIVGVSQIRLIADGAELWIRRDEILRESSAVTQNRA